MSSCRDIVAGALRKLGKLGSGRTPRQADEQDAFGALTGLYRFLITSGAFGRLQDVIPQSDYTARWNERVFRTQDATLSVTLPQTLSNAGYWGDYYIYGYPYFVDNDRVTPRDCSVVTVVDSFTGVTADFIYDGELKSWQGLYDLTLDSEAPLSTRDPEGLKAYLATHIVGEFGGELSQFDMQRASTYVTALTHRYSQQREIAPMEYF